ncbi:MAG: tyrosine-protein phosphatase [Gammaproteobacteria bacterium]
MDPVTEIDVARDARGHYRIDWTRAFGACPGDVRVALTPAALAQAPLAAHGTGALEVAPLAHARRHYFRLEPAAAEAVVVAERGVTFAGGVNFRDLGGYRTAHGRRLRWGRLFRSGHMAGLTADDKTQFAALDIRTVCDFRLAEERASENAELPGDVRMHTIGIPPGIGDRHFFHRLFASADSVEPILAALHDMLRSLVREAAPNYRRLFEVLLAAPDGAVLMNCSAGKERTGVGSALVLAALGVPRATIMYDFMLSGTYFPAAAEVPRVLEKYAVAQRGELGRTLIMPLLETRASYLDAAFDAIDQDFGSIENFLAHHYGLRETERARLRDIYTA